MSSTSAIGPSVPATYTPITPPAAAGNATSVAAAAAGSSCGIYGAASGGGGASGGGDTVQLSSQSLALAASYSSTTITASQGADSVAALGGSTANGNDMLELVMALMIMAYLLGGPEMMNNMMSMFQDMFGLGSDDASGSGASSLGDAMAAYGAYGGASGGGASGGVMMQSTSISIAMSQSTMSVSGGLDVLG